jgi:hypothetical protein
MVSRAGVDAEETRTIHCLSGIEIRPSRAKPVALPTVLSGLPHADLYSTYLGYSVPRFRHLTFRTLSDYVNPSTCNNHKPPETTDSLSALFVSTTMERSCCQH